MATREREADVRRQLDRLAALRLDPAARSRFALELVTASSRADVLFPAAESLEAHPLPDAREPLLAAFARISADAKRRDPGGELRAALLRALRKVAGREDVPVFEGAAQVYETSVQGPAATAVRAVALVALVDLAPDIAALHAARILAEADDPGRTHTATGEPSLTAARVLGALGETTALYLAVSMNWRPPEELLAECLRQLTGLPGDAAIGLVTRFSGQRGDLVHLGLVDLVAEHESLPADAAPAVARWLRDAGLDVYRYALTAFVAARNNPAHNLAAALLEEEFDRDRLSIAAEALGLARGVPALERARKTVEERLA